MRSKVPPDHALQRLERSGEAEGKCAGRHTSQLLPRFRTCGIAIQASRGLSRRSQTKAIYTP
jgi:hypothetical protein